MLKIIAIITILFSSNLLLAQEIYMADTVIQLEEAVVKGYMSRQPLLRTPTSVGIVHIGKSRKQAGKSLLPALNSLPGVRMQQRSPGSYRLSVRGSMMRSPWGVRNVKVYIDEFPLTNAGGSTYLNLIDPRGISRIEVLKGPHGSLYGANSGGVVLIDLVGQQTDTSMLRVGISGGSYGMVHQNVSVQKRWKESQFNLNQAFLRSDGYRENAAMQRHYIQASEQWNYSPDNELKVLAFYTDLSYRTPGGLTKEQYEEDPQQARQPSGSNPGAVEQKAGIENRTFFGGISHEATLTDRLRHVAAVFGSHTDLENPFITNYEVRNENNYGVRTYLELKSPDTGASFDWKWNLGLEWQRSLHDITNYDNIGNATKGALQASDEFLTHQHFYFTKFSANLFDKWTAEAAVSLNYYKYVFEGQTTDGNGSGKSNFSPEWMPRVSLSYLVTPDMAWRASVSRGYSPPTTAEIRPSNLVINTDLEAETGWNYETGFRYMSRDNRFQMDASVFYYRMQQAIVRRLDAGDAEFFINAGGTEQLGFESIITSWLIEPDQNGFIRGLKLSNSYTYSHFEFEKFIDGTEDYSGNRLTGVPRHVVVSSLALDLPKSFSLFVRHNYTGRIPLNDANTVYADSYHLIQAKAEWRTSIYGKYSIRIFAGVDNLLNEKYSLGNDINAYGRRFFNAAPLRNYFVGLSFSL